MNLKRIVIVNDASVPRGGATGLAVLSARRLLERGHAVTFICGDDGDNQTLRAAGAEIVALGGRRLLDEKRGRAALAGVFNADARDLLAGWIARADTPDTVYHVHGWAQILSPSIFGALAPVAARTVIHAHDMFLACPNGFYMDYQRNRVCRRAPLGASCLVTHCDKRSYAHKGWRVVRQVFLRRQMQRVAHWGAVIMIHPAMRAGLERAGYPADRLRTLRNPGEAFTTERVRAEDNDTLVFIGRLEAEKGVGDLAAAAKRTGMPLLMIGDGPMRETLARRFPAIHFAGWCDRSEIAPLLAKARAIVIPTRHPEPFGLVAAEASMSGVPVLIARTALLASEIEGHGLGIAFDVFDPPAFDDALRRIRNATVEDIRAMSERGASGRVPVGSTPEGWIDGMLELYRQALEQANGGGRGTAPAGAQQAIDRAALQIVEAR